MNLTIQSFQLPAHTINILLHVGFGSLAIFLGIIQLFSRKGGHRHRVVGQAFLCCYAVVIATATIGALFFDFRVFLVVLTMTAAYSSISGYRVLRLRGNRPGATDNVFAVAGIVFSIGFLLRMDDLPLIMAKTVVLSTLASLLLFCAYDLARNIFTLTFLSRVWLFEHVVKMISALGALWSAASGNLLPEFGVISQLLPTVAGFFMILIFASHALRNPVCEIE